VLALGHPGGFDPQRPVVARLGRILRLSSDLLQTDCTLFSGDSGGPLFDMHGRVIGIHSRISDSTRANFHVSITTYDTGWDRLAKGDDWGRPPPLPRSFVGAMGVDDPEGCRLERVDDRGPASQAGLKVGDVVVKINGQAIKDGAAFRESVGRAKPGETLTLEVKRGDLAQSVRVTVEARRGRGRGRFGP
jgi:serine protease Do